MSDTPSDSREKLLLLVCCAPCATHVVRELEGRYRLTAFFYNPNIHPEEEYRRRLGEAERLAGEYGFALREGEYAVDAWREALRGCEEEPEGGERCRRCIRMRLEKAAAHAAAEGYPLLATTLTISPHKNARMVNEQGRGAAEARGIRFLELDFKKQGGFQKSIALSRELGLYRQDYCGCEYSLGEARARRGKKNRPRGD